MINKDTQLHISVAKAPGNFGATVYNELFKKYSINAVYLPKKLENIDHLPMMIRELEIRGCSITMPFKSQVAQQLDELDDIVLSTGSVNTIVNDGGVLKGFNTDYFGALEVLNQAAPKSAVIYGAGSVVHSVILALKDYGCQEIAIVARRQEMAKEISEKYGVRHFNSVKDVRGEFDLLINATPASSQHDHELMSLLQNAAGLFDLVVSPRDTALVEQARQQGKKVCLGLEMSKLQLQKQFQYYTGLMPEMGVLDAIVAELYAV